MKKTVTVLCSAIIMLFGLAGCSGKEISETESTSAENETVSELDSESSATSPENETVAETDSESSNNAAVHIEEIDWNVAESILDGERIVSFSYTNNSKYTILEIEMQFKQKEGITAEQLAVFDNIKKECELTDDEVAEISITACNKKCADPGETVSGSPCYIEDTYSYVENITQYELMEPDIMTIYFIGNDGKGYTMYYDFKSHNYSESSLGGQNIQKWSDSELSKLLPKPLAPEIKTDIDDENLFMFSVHGITIDEYEAYIEEVTASGFSNVVIRDKRSYYSSNADGVSVSIYYDAVDEEMNGSISA